MGFAFFAGWGVCQLIHMHPEHFTEQELGSFLLLLKVYFIVWLGKMEHFSAYGKLGFQIVN